MVYDRHERIDREANALEEERIQNVFEGLPEAESLDAEKEELGQKSANSISSWRVWPSW